MRRIACAVAILAAAFWAQQAAGIPFSLSSDEFPLIMHSVDSPAFYQGMVDAGITYVHTYDIGRSTNEADLADDHRFFNAAEPYGLKVMANLDGHNWVDAGEVENMRTIVREYKDEPSLAFWYLYEEPFNRGTTVSDLQPFYDMIEAETPGILISVLHADNDTCDDFTNVQDIVLVDSYSVIDDPFPNEPVNWTTDAMRYAINTTGQPVIPMLQCYMRGTRFPVREELRYWAYASLAMGVRGLCWFGRGQSFAGDGGVWFNSTFGSMSRKVKRFVDLVESVHDPDRLKGLNVNDGYFLGVWDRGSAGKWVVLVNDENYSRPSFTAPMNRFSYDVDLWPYDGTRDSSATIVNDVLAVELGPWEAYVWEALPLGLRIPTNVQATPQSAGRIDVTWTDTSTTETKFKIDRQTAGTTNWIRVGDAPANTTKYRDDVGLYPLAPNSTYTYKVKAYNLNGNCRYSSEASATTFTGIDVRPADGSDDAEENLGTGNTNTNSLDLDLITSGPVDQLVGIRFPGVSIPQGATIDAATLEFTVAAAGSDPTSLTLHGQAIDHAPPFVDQTGNISARATTRESVAWDDVPAWSTVGGSGPARRTPDLAGIIQAIVDRPGWVNGNALALIISGTGERSAVSYDGDPATAPYLHIQYSVPQHFVAYNDLAWFDGQLSNNITCFTTTNNFPAANHEGALRDYATGEDVTVRVSVQGGSAPIESQGLHPAQGTDAHNVFTGRANGDGAISYSGDDLVLTLTGLSTDKRYEFALYGDRGGTTYTGGASRYQHATLTGADSFVNASTPGTALLTNSVPNDTTLYNAGYNNPSGFLTRFSEIDPGADGKIVLTVARDTDLSYYTYANAFMLASHDIVKVANGTTWKYRKGTDEASDPTHDWRTIGFNDAAWSNGVAPFGYGDGPYSTTLDHMQGNYMSVCLRTPFTIDRPTRVSRVELRVLFDDGLIAWINGAEVGRTNMATGPGTFVPYDTAAATSINGPDEWILVLEGRTLPPLVDGANILAVQVFNGTLSSSDLTLDCRLTVAEGERVLEDADGDGMSDPWEIDVFGGTSVSNAANGQDFDLDGLLNIQEFIAGSNPDDPTDLFQVDVHVSDGKVIVSLDGVQATGNGYEAVTRFYAIEQRSALDPIGVWQAAIGYEAVEATGQAIAYTNSTAADLTVYRGRVWLQPE